MIESLDELKISVDKFPESLKGTYRDYFMVSSTNLKKLFSTNTIEILRAKTEAWDECADQIKTIAKQMKLTPFKDGGLPFVLMNPYKAKYLLSEAKGDK